MNPSSSTGRPVERRPEEPRHGEDALERRARSPPGSSTRPSASRRATTPVLSSTPAARSSSATAALASSPNSDSGLRSGVTTVTLTSSWPIARASPAVISASS